MKEAVALQPPACPTCLKTISSCQLGEAAKESIGGKPGPTQSCEDVAQNACDNATSAEWTCPIIVKEPVMQGHAL